MDYLFLDGSSFKMLKSHFQMAKNGDRELTVDNRGVTNGLGLRRASGTSHRAVSHHLTLTDFSRRLLVRDGYPADRIEVKANAAPDPGWLTDPAAVTVERHTVFAGRLLDIKGVLICLDAWARMPAGMKLVIAEDGLVGSPGQWLH